MSRLPALRRLGHGALSGVLLSCLRAPLGLDWTQIATVQGTTAGLFRGAALLALAVSLDPRRPILGTGLGAGWLSALGAGFALHGLWLDSVPGSRAGYVLALVAGSAALMALAGARTRPPDERPADALGRWDRAGLLGLGLGFTLALESLAHELRLFTLGTRGDDTVVGSAFVLLLVAGAVAFGPLFVRLGSERLRFPTGIAAAASATLAGLAYLSVLGPDGLHAYLRRLDPLLGWLRPLDARLGGHLGLSGIPTLDGASIGTLWATGILSVAALVAPGFVLGATIGTTRNVGRVAHALVGGALALILWPHLVGGLGRPLDAAEVDGVSFAWNFVAAGAGVAALGAAVVAVGARSGTAIGLACVIALVPWIRPHLVIWSFSPWSPHPVRPELVWPTAEGLMTLETARKTTILTLDRKRLTPLTEEEPEDERRLRLAWALGLRESGDPVRGLLVGQITPARARVVRSFEGLELERTATWHAAMPIVEERLFRGQEAPPGRVISPAEARRKLKRGQYDWVVALPIQGPVVSWKSEARSLWGAAEGPSLADLELEDGVVGVALLSGETILSRGTTLAPLLLSVDQAGALSVALVRGAPRAPERDRGPVFTLEDHRGPSPFEVGTTMPQQRSYLLARALAESLRCEARQELALGLARMLGAQTLSSPYEPMAAQIEVDEDALRLFFEDAGKVRELDRLTRELWESLAWIFSGKREPELSLVYLEPLANRFAPWPALDLAVAHAYREVLEPESALPFLERARGVRPNEPDILLEAARCTEDLGRHAQALELLERAWTLAPHRADLERALGLAYFRAGDVRGRPLLEALLTKDPEDPELLRILHGEGKIEALQGPEK